MAFEVLTLLSVYGDKDDDEIEEEYKLGFEFGGIALLSVYGDKGDEIEDDDNPIIIPSNNNNNTLNYGTASSIPSEEDAVMVSFEEQKQKQKEEDVDHRLDKFLPRANPEAKCSEELQQRVIEFLALKTSFASEVRNKKEYRNPNYLINAVTIYGLDQIGSCFRKDVFDPHRYDDKSDEILADIENTTTYQRLDFITPQPLLVPAAPKITRGTTSDVRSQSKWISVRDGQLNKKSKRFTARDVSRQNKVRYQRLNY